MVPRPVRPSASCVLKFQQTTGPVMAKGVEDTIFYVYNRLVSLNEVGGEPDRFGRSVAEFHRDNLARSERWPHAMLATSTHDTKRSEDVRARISVLSELPREWSGALGRWRRLNARHRRRVDGYAAPDRNDEYLLYQTLLGVWPFEPLDGAGRAELVERVQAYLLKATREAKVHTTWINPNQEYDQAVADFIAAMLDQRQNAAFLSSFEPLRHRVAHLGVFNSLSQTLLKLTTPGVPDIYQGTELWDFSLVDPDNRRPVDYERRVQLLKELRTQIARRRGSLAGLAKELLASREDGRVKLYLTQRALQFRSRCPTLFESGAYRPLEAEGAYGDRLVAFSREREETSVIVVAPRLVATLVRDAELPLGSSVWGDTWLDLAAPPGTCYRDLFSGLVLQSEARDGRGGLTAGAIFEHFPSGCWSAWVIDRQFDSGTPMPDAALNWTPITERAARPAAASDLAAWPRRRRRSRRWQRPNSSTSWPGRPATLAVHAARPGWPGQLALRG